MTPLPSELRAASRMNVFLEFRKADRRPRGQDRGTAPVRRQGGAARRSRTASTSTRRSRASRARPTQLIADTYARLTPWQKTQVARHPARPHFSDYVARADHRIHAARRRPSVRRRPGDRRRARPLSRPSGCRRRPREGQRHQVAAEAQFRHGDARGLSQGAAPVRAWPTASACR